MTPTPDLAPTPRFAWLSATGRISRTPFACGATLCLLTPHLLSGLAPVAFALWLAVAIASLTLYVFFVIKRLRDMGVSPWLGVVAWLPLFNLPLLFIPSQSVPVDSSQQATSRSHPLLLRLGAVLLPLLYLGLMSNVILTLYAELLPTYQHYEQQQR